MNWIRVSIKGSQLLSPFSSSDFATFKYGIGERRERGCVAALTKGDRMASRQTCCRAEVCSRGRRGQALSEPSEYISDRSTPGLIENFKEGSLRLEWCDRGIGDSQWSQALSTPPLQSQGHGPPYNRSVAGGVLVLGCLAPVWGSHWFLLCRGASCSSLSPRIAWPTTVLFEYQEISEQFLWVSATGRETLTLNSTPLPHGDQIAAKDLKGLASVRGLSKKDFFSPLWFSGLMFAETPV